MSHPTIIIGNVGADIDIQSWTVTAVLSSGLQIDSMMLYTVNMGNNAGITISGNTVYFTSFTMYNNVSLRIPLISGSNGGTITRTLSTAGDTNLSNNSTTQTILAAAGGGGGSGSSVDLYISPSQNPGSGTVGDNLTGSVYVYAASGGANNVTVTASIPGMNIGYPYPTLVATNADSVSGNIMEGWIATRSLGSSVSNGGPFTIVLGNNMAAGSININRQTTTSSNDSNLSNNSYNMPFTRQ